MLNAKSQFHNHPVVTGLAYNLVSQNEINSVVLNNIAQRLPKPSEAKDDGGLKLLWIMISVLALGAVPMVYLRPNLFHYDATYITEQDVQFPPFMSNWDHGTDC